MSRKDGLCLVPRLLPFAVVIALAACLHPRAPAGLDEPGLIALRRQIHQNPNALSTVQPPRDAAS
jgi:hypothetical protein